MFLHAPTPRRCGHVAEWAIGVAVQPTKLAYCFSNMLHFQIFYISNIGIFQWFFFFTIVFLYKGGAIIFRDLSEACIMLSDLRGTLNISHIGEKGSPYHTGLETLKISNCSILSDSYLEYIPSHQSPLSKWLLSANQIFFKWPESENERVMSLYPAMTHHPPPLLLPPLLFLLHQEHVWGKKRPKWGEGEGDFP